jgi:hypothetical protein
MAYLVEFHAITKILLILREITKKITKNFQLPKKSEKSRNITKSNQNYQIWWHCFVHAQAAQSLNVLYILNI